MVKSYILQESEKDKKIDKRKQKVLFPYDKLLKYLIRQHPQGFIDALNLNIEFKEFLSGEFINQVYEQSYGDIVLLSKDKRIHIIEFQTNYLNIRDKRRFGNYQTTLHLKESKEVIVHVVSLVGKKIEDIPYGYGNEYGFTIHYTSLNCLKSTKTLNKIIKKILNNADLSEKEIVYFELFPLMERKKDKKKALKKGIMLVSQIETLSKETIAEIKLSYGILALALFDDEEIEEIEEAMDMESLDKAIYMGKNTYMDLKYRFKYEILSRRHIKEAKKEAREEGRIEGRIEGREEGRIEAENKRNHEIAQDMIEDGRYSIEEIAKISKLEKSIINQLILGK